MWAVALAALLSSTASAQTICHAENDGPNFMDNVSMGGPGLLLGVQFTSPISFDVTRMEIFTGEGSGANTLSIWSHDSGNNQPGAQLGGQGSWAMSAANDWQGADLTTPTSLTAGTVYWMVWGCINGSQCSVDLPQTFLGQPYMGSFNGGGSWSGPFQFADRHWKFRLYGNCGGGPIVYCTAKMNSLGCTPAMAFAGTPSKAGTGTFDLTASQVINNKNGICFYGFAPAAIPFQGGYLCVQPPIKRTPVQNSGGNPPPNDCSGTFALDFNTIAPGDPNILVGTTVDSQYWYRDPASPSTTGLTDAVEFVVGP